MTRTVLTGSREFDRQCGVPVVQHAHPSITTC